MPKSVQKLSKIGQNCQQLSKIDKKLAKIERLPHQLCFPHCAIQTFENDLPKGILAFNISKATTLMSITQIGLSSNSGSFLEKAIVEIH